MNKLKYIWMLIALFSLFSCSDSETEEVNENTAQQVFNRMKGTYQGTAIVGTVSGMTSQRVTVVVGDDLTIYDLPLQPIIERIFTDREQQAEALSAAPYGTMFRAPINGISIMPYQAALTTEDSDLSFSVPVGGTTYQVTALINTSALMDNMSNSLSINMIVKELLCNGLSVSMGDTPISYLIDSALRQEQQ
ncbi:MAG: DUF4840 domain-containing protein [Prevotella sp.]|nr:DUF4840 domain-containing protein [Prevotella sp.]